MLTLFRCPLITENKHLLRGPELSSVTRNCQINIMPLDTLKKGIYKLKDFTNCIKLKRNNLLNSIYSSVSPDFRFKETPYVNFFTDPELSSSLYIYITSGSRRPPNALGPMIFMPQALNVVFFFSLAWLAIPSKPSFDRSVAKIC